MSTVDEQQADNGPQLSVLGEAALVYAARGWKIIPLWSCTGSRCECMRGLDCRTPGKHPRLDNWDEHFTDDPRTIRLWWMQNPHANVGTVLGPHSGIFVVDIDGPDGEAVLERYELGTKIEGESVTIEVFEPGADEPLRAEYELWSGGHGGFRPTIEVRSGSGGAHLYFRYPAKLGGVIKNQAPWLEYDGLDGHVDIRGRNGLAVLPPSIHESGNRYEWTDASFDQNNQLGDPAPPPLDVELSNDNGRVAKSLADALAVPERKDGSQRATNVEPNVSFGQIKEGGRNNTLNKRAAQRRRFGASDEDIRHSLHLWNKEDCTPPLDDTEVEDIINSVLQMPRGETSEQYFAAFQTERLVRGESAQGKFALNTLDEIRNLEPPRWYVRDLVAEKSLGVLWGQPGVNKSFIMFDMAAHVAMGMDWLGKKVRQGRVVYIALEGYTGYKLRLAAWEKRNGKLDGDQFRMADWFDLANDDTVADEIEKLREFGPSMIVIDTLSQASIGVEENSNTEMTRVADRVKWIADAIGAALVVVHHGAKSSSGNTPRGAGAIMGNTTWHAEVEGSRDKSNPTLDVRVINVHKQRDGETIKLPLAMEKVDLGHSPEGEPWSSLVVAAVPMVGANAAPPPTPDEVRQTEILRFVGENPGCSLNAAAKGAGGNKANTLELIHQLVAAGRLTNVDGLRADEAT